MKKLALILSAIAILGISNVNASNNNKSDNDKIRDSEMQILPYGISDLIPMVEIISNGEYSIFRTESKFVGNIPSCQPVGKNYHYFVYKDGKFLMTVNECNKDKVYNYFVE
jgi:hypothetical protein